MGEEGQPKEEEGQEGQSEAMFRSKPRNQYDLEIQTFERCEIVLSVGKRALQWKSLLLLTEFLSTGRGMKFEFENFVCPPLVTC